MPTEEDYVQRIRKFGRKRLLDLCRAVMPTEAQKAGVGRQEERKGFDWPPGKAFELLVLRAFELDGADIRWPFRVHIEGEEVEQIDGAAHAGGMSCLIESKDLSEDVAVAPIAKLRNQLLRRPAGTVGVIFSSRGFTEAARILARFLAPQSILLWTGDEVEFAIERRIMVAGLLRKFQHLVEFGDYELRDMILDQ
jgi:hypothetical protein